MRFGVFTDLHYDAIPDADRRVDDLINSFTANNVDFVIDLGDSIFAKDENLKIISRFKELPCYFSIGNHNIDFCANETALSFLGLDSGYHSILRENIKFIFLDANYAKTPDGFVHEDKAKKIAGVYQPYVPTEQIEWLKNEIKDDSLFYIICTHQSLSNDLVLGNHSRGIMNRNEIRAILEKRNIDGKKVLFCMNGHDHGDRIRLINGIYYYSLNSASHIWQHNDVFMYDEDLHNRFPHLKNYIVYEEALHIIVNVDEKMNVAIQGMEGRYQKVTPKDVGMGDEYNGVSIKPRTSSLYISFE